MKCGVAGIGADTDIYLVPSWRRGKPVFVGYSLPRDSLRKHSALLNSRKLPLVLDLDLTLVHSFFAKDLNKRIEATNRNGTTCQPADELLSKLSEFASAAQKCRGQGQGVKCTRTPWRRTNLVLTRCAGLDGTDKSFSFAIVERPGVHDFILQIQEQFELYMYSNGLQPYVSETMRGTGLIKSVVLAKGRARNEDPTTKTLEDRHFPYSSVLSLILDDCDRASSAKSKRRVWPLHSNNCLLVQPFDGLDLEADRSALKRVLSEVRLIHKMYYKNIDIFLKDTSNPAWLERTLEKSANGQKTCPVIPDTISKVQRGE
eukprot:TRINITY_DN18264_c0_g2_i1.p1 TRINITY_DN18264_c0_g2~~TRINITY_DN18264_c0_g2_i1.p1  ORF type:complete len:316 (-),score=52.71 TRINITY_DN18264_c0_g2_i1:159-1106(-)